MLFLRRISNPGIFLVHFFPTEDAGTGSISLAVHKFLLENASIEISLRGWQWQMPCSKPIDIHIEYYEEAKLRGFILVTYSSRFIRDVVVPDVPYSTTFFVRGSLRCFVPKLPEVLSDTSVVEKNFSFKGSIFPGKLSHR